MWQIWLVYNGFTRGSIVSCHGMVRGDDEGYSNRRYKRNSYAAIGESANWKTLFLFFSPFFFLPFFSLFSLFSFCLRSVLIFFFFRLILIAWSRPTRFLITLSFLSFFLSFFFFLSLETSLERVSPFIRSLFSLFARFLLLRLVAQSSDQIMGYFYWIPVNTYPPFNRFDCS